ncbi:Uncharacterised protein [uncultured archaeon]|nr:Uncharacterised protein [uncultured archaeon]
MNAKNILVSFLLIASVLFLASAVSAATVTNAAGTSVQVNGEDVASASNTFSVVAGDTITVQVKFTAIDLDSSTVAVDGSASDVKVKATIEGDKDDVTAVTSGFDVIGGKVYTKTLTLKVPSNLEDASELLPLTVKVGDDEVFTASLSVQKPSYNVAIKSVMTGSAMSAGQTVPVQVVLKNDGYNDVEDLYVTVSISELNLQKQVYFGDLVTEENSDSDNKASVSGTVYLDVPFNAKAGAYTLTVEASNDDFENTVTKQVTIENSVSDVAIRSGNNLVLLNPTNKLVVYTVSYQSNTATVVIPAESSQTVPIVVPNGDYKFDVSVFSGATLLSTVNFSGSNAAISTASPVLVLTVILAIVFLVLLVVLVVLITKKPQKAEDFGESYY